jgi:phosphoglycolate phosphatase
MHDFSSHTAHSDALPPPNSRPYDVLIFDWDGTLMDSTSTIAACIQAACIAVGEPEPTLELAKHVIGLGLRDALTLCAPHLPPEKYPELSKHYHNIFLEQAAHLRLFDTVLTQLDAFIAQGYLLAVATGKNRRGLDHVLQYSQLSRLFTATRTPDECEPKPSPDMVLQILAQLNIPANRALVIGDTTHDMLMAQNAGVACFAVAQGAHSAEKLANINPTHLAQHIRELSPWLSMQ